MFVEGKSAMFHGHPTVMQQLQKQMDAELIRIPYFSQTSDESYVYMTPSLNIAFNKNLEKDREKLDTALDVLDCMISEEGQKLIADGSGVISLNTDVPTMMQDVPGLEDEIKIMLFISDIPLKNHLMQVLRLFTDYCQGNG